MLYISVAISELSKYILNEWNCESTDYNQHQRYPNSYVLQELYFKANSCVRKINENRDFFISML